MKKLVAVGLIVISSLSFANIKTAGLAGVSTNLYKAKHQIRPLPLVNVTYGKFYINGGTLGVNTYSVPEFKFNLIMEPLSGYFNGWSINGSDFKKFDLDDRNPQFMGGISTKFELSEETIGEINYLWGEKGSKGELNLSQVIYINDRLSLIPTATFKYYEKEYLDYYIGVSQKEAIKNADNSLKKYSASDSFSVGVNIAAEISLTEQLITSIFIGCEYYGDKISDSPIIKRDYQIYQGIGLRYSF